MTIETNIRVTSPGLSELRQSPPRAAARGDGPATVVRLSEIAFSGSEVLSAPDPEQESVLDSWRAAVQKKYSEALERA